MWINSTKIYLDKFQQMKVPPLYKPIIYRYSARTTQKRCCTDEKKIDFKSQFKSPRNTTGIYGHRRRESIELLTNVNNS